MAFLELVLGPMFSGKSTECCRLLSRMTFTGGRCAAIKYSADNRYTDEDVVATHSGAKYPALVATHLESLMPVLLRDYDVIGIDEGQFFEDLVDCVHTLLDAEKYVIVGALDGDFLQQPFWNVLQLIPVANKVTKLTAVCMMCTNRDAPFTVRITDSTEIVQIGGAESYRAVCRPCLTHFREEHHSEFFTPEPSEDEEDEDDVFDATPDAPCSFV
ncbi:thymidine kinase [Cyprinid herpesvirus 2]|uniref:Thymidine kinase n=1 Tax=Cyprinid herpesvirus 2 TaxID=317878 RepID=K7PBF5_CYHV2|nr:thymidine kinase [Cyprinid herpesvirus 2]AFJ20489.1 thymidine kinase [Cyprinid herpesvirus 2]